jgi:cell division protein FtsI/penicillin-binding protein 2
MNSENIPRIRILFIFPCLFGLIIIARLYNLQIINGDKYVNKADSQYIRNSDNILDRGIIFFEGKDEIRAAGAIMKDGYTLVINPKKIENPDYVYDALSQYVEINKEEFIAKTKRDDQYEEIKKRLTKEIGISIQSLKIPGVSVIKDSWRVYPGGSIASQTIGITGYGNSDTIAGRYGLESYYDDVLGRSKSSQNINFFAELFADIKSGIINNENKKGDIVTTIDPAVQSYVEGILKKTKDTWKSDSIGAIVMNPQNGEVYTMASLPNFDPNNLKEVSDPKVFSNPMVENAYEMGSIIKPLTVAVGIDTGAITKNSSYDDTGFMLLNGKRIANYDGKARGTISVKEILGQSLNVGAATVALKVGNDKFSEYFRSFGIGDKTGIDQPNETIGITDNLDSNRDIEHATASYGQGIAISPITTVRALSIIANGGLLVKPHLVKKIEYTDGSFKDTEIGEYKRVIDESSAKDVTAMLISVVDNSISKAHPGIKMEHYSIAAKTGTAQIADHVNGGYYSDRYLHSFFGFFPAYDPKVIVFLYQVYPKGAQYASETLVDPFIDITKFLISYYDIPPDR